MRAFSSDVRGVTQNWLKSVIDSYQVWEGIQYFVVVCAWGIFKGMQYSSSFPKTLDNLYGWACCAMYETISCPTWGWSSYAPFLVCAYARAVYLNLNYAAHFFVFFQKSKHTRMPAVRFCGTKKYVSCECEFLDCVAYRRRLFLFVIRSVMSVGHTNQQQCYR